MYSSSGTETQVKETLRIVETNEHQDADAGDENTRSRGLAASFESRGGVDVLLTSAWPHRCGSGHGDRQLTLASAFAAWRTTVYVILVLLRP